MQRHERVTRTLLDHLRSTPAPAPTGGEPCTSFYDGAFASRTHGLRQRQRTDSDSSCPRWLGSHAGLPVMDNFHDETVEHFRGVEMLDDDVMLVTFPKCGTSA